ncbi:hypothetical protein IPH25_02950 [bacterium]|nr:MAG: hypothetical protein IPG37_05090 [bacterium]QQR61424.1 MAG: hypothetical protein IPH25_02950 [bacterium]QQR63054.1 MAG: hypothetical protein IPH67_01080 [bacterium]
MKYLSLFIVMSQFLHGHTIVLNDTELSIKIVNTEGTTIQELLPHNEIRIESQQENTTMLFLYKAEATENSTPLAIITIPQTTDSEETEQRLLLSEILSDAIAFKKVYKTENKLSLQQAAVLAAMKQKQSPVCTSCAARKAQKRGKSIVLTKQ